MKMKYSGILVLNKTLAWTSDIQTTDDIIDEMQSISKEQRQGLFCELVNLLALLNSKFSALRKFVANNDDKNIFYEDSWS